VLVDVILPCLDEAAALPVLLGQLPPSYRAIVADNGSTDGSPAIAAAHGATVIHEPQRGFGAACHAGLLAATANVVCFLDADGSLDPAELPRVVEPIHTGRADLVLGRRRPTTPGAFPLPTRMANAILARSIRQRTGVSLRDLGPMRSAWREPLLQLAVADRRFGWPLEMVTRAADAQWRIAEVDVSYAPRIGRSKVTGTWRGTVRTVRDMRRVLAS
jgi:glycosyltransferase involved in cell wall biosynthesis